ncbi:methyl-accepting chemotaxis protein [Piscinibacter sakaiensis]|uniref:methyl-accepting chemotaxis protein n=1 Tax=Piscinibacter sakaiensis TaxID=1547922 RepID=UPI00372D7E87
MQTMQGIADSSRRIAEITGLIDGIAFRTNLLALNAAVEAARAGDQGRGFAVVAAEVRSLAQRSADAAREVRSLILDSTERVGEGSALMDRAGSTMDDIVGAVREVHEIMATLGERSRRQTEEVEALGDVMRQMDQATQQNAAMVEQLAAAADSLKAQSGELVGAVEVFVAPPGPAAA